jgi:hypothetical protein
VADDSLGGATPFGGFHPEKRLSEVCRSSAVCAFWQLGETWYPDQACAVKGRRPLTAASRNLNRGEIE